MSNIARKYVDKAFGLSFFLHPRRQIALEVTKRALANLEVSANAQFKRFYYQPKGRLRSHASLFKKRRTRVTLPDPALLQRLIYIESDPIERQQEITEMGVTSDDMVVRYIKHLVRITIRRNSFYVALGLCRLLHHYSTAETMDIYNVLAQSWEGDKDADYYRASKKRLMSELHERFGDSVNAKRGPRGEQRFEAQDVTKNLVNLVRQALDHFTPWDSACPIPVDFDPHLRELESYHFDGEDPDEEHVVEINRIHTMLHPPCFDRLLESMHLAAAEERLEVPLFNVEPFDRDGQSADRMQPPVLAAEEKEAVLIYLKERQALRNSWRPADVAVWIDGCRRMVWNPTDQARLDIKVHSRSEILELRTISGAPLASYILDASMLKVSQRLTTRIGKQRLVLNVGPQSESNAEMSFQVQLELQPAGILRHSTLLVNRVLDFFIPGNLEPQRLGLIMRPLAGLALMLMVGFLYFQSEGVSPSYVAPPGVEGEAWVQPLMPSSESVTEPLTRSSALEPKSTPAFSQRIHKIFVDPLGEDSFGKSLRKELAFHLKESGTFEIVQERDLADAVLMDIAEFLMPPSQALRKRERFLVLSLVTVDNKEVWRMSRVVGLDSPAEMVNQLADEIATDIITPE